MVWRSTRVFRVQMLDTMIHGCISSHENWVPKIGSILLQATKSVSFSFFQRATSIQVDRGLKNVWNRQRCNFQPQFIYPKFLFDQMIVSLYPFLLFIPFCLSCNICSFLHQFTRPPYYVYSFGWIISFNWFTNLVWCMEYIFRQFYVHSHTPK